MTNPSPSRRTNLLASGLPGAALAGAWMPPAMRKAHSTNQAARVTLQPVSRPANEMSAAELVLEKRIKLKPVARTMLNDEMLPLEYFDALLAAEQLADARRVLAYILPQRRSLWWGAMTAATVTLEPVAQKAVSEVVAYVIRPGENLRYRIGETMKACGVNTMAGCLAGAAFCTGASIAPQGLPVVKPRPHVVGRLVATTVYLASVLETPKTYRQKLYEFLTAGRQLTSGNPPWEPSTHSSHNCPNHAEHGSACQTVEAAH